MLMIRVFLFGVLLSINLATISRAEILGMRSHLQSCV